MASIEQEIQQSKFASPYQKVVVNTLFTASWINANSNRILKPHGLSVQQYNILRILRGQKGNGISVNSLIERMLDKNSNASRLVEKLRQKGFVERKTCEYDRRQVDVLITKEGLKFLDDIAVEFEDFDHMTDLLTEKEALQLSDLLDKLRG